MADDLSLWAVDYLASWLGYDHLLMMYWLLLMYHHSSDWAPDDILLLMLTWLLLIPPNPLVPLVEDSFQSIQLISIFVDLVGQLVNVSFVMGRVLCLMESGSEFLNLMVLLADVGLELSYPVGLVYDFDASLIPHLQVPLKLTNEMVPFPQDPFQPVELMYVLAIILMLLRESVLPSIRDQLSVSFHKQIM